jgi:hypothetical protein
MVYIAKKIVKGIGYYYLAEGKKNKKKKVEQKILYYIGNKEKLLAFHEMIKRYV